MEFKIGKVYSYDNELGKIITTDEEYIFNSNDLEETDIVKGDVVKFRPETINDINRAFFISKVEEKKYESDNKTMKKVIIDE